MFAKALRRSLFAGLLLSVLSTNGQDPAPRVPDQAGTIADLLDSMALSDASGDAAAAIRARLGLSRLVMRGEKLRLLEQASVLADSISDPHLGLQVHTALEEAYWSAGRAEQAREEAFMIRSLIERSAADSIAALLAERDGLLQAMDMQRDSTSKALEQARQAAEVLRSDGQRREDLWKGVAAVLLLLGLLAVIVLLRRTDRIVRKALKDKGSPGPDKARAANDRRETMRPNRVREGPSTPAGQVTDDPEAFLVALYSNKGPERLATLRKARASADHEKVLRVVHSVKPQLVGLDAERFAPLCTRITAEDARMDMTIWNADLDRLERGMQELLERLQGS